MFYNKGKKLIQGFTLVELSIVIIIIGLLISGITAGASLIKLAALNSVMSDVGNYQSAYNNFIARYNAIPGDMQNSEAYFPTCSTIAGDCNGNGNGVINYDAGVPDETYSAWRTMSLAGFIGVNITQIPTNWNGIHIVGSTVPASKISEAGYIMVAYNWPSIDEGGWTRPGYSAYILGDENVNALYIGRSSSYPGGLAKGALSVQDAYNLDQKFDDGKPASNLALGNYFSGSHSGKIRMALPNVVIQCAPVDDGVGHYSDFSTVGTPCVVGFALN